MGAPLVAAAPLIVAPLFVLLLSWLAAAVGRRAMIALGVPATESLATRGVVALALGMGVLEFIPFFLGVFGLLRTQTLLIALGVFVLLLLRDLRAVARAVRSAIRQGVKPERSILAWVAVLSPAILAATLSALSPTVDPDGLAYHLTVPKRWLTNGVLDYLPTYPYSNTPMGVEMLFTLALPLVGDEPAKLLHVTLGSLGAVALYLGGVRLHGRLVGMLAATLYLVGPFGVSSVLGYAYLEGAITLAAGTSILAWMLWFRGREPGWLRCACVLAGVAASFKISAVLFAAAIGALTLLALGWDARSRGQSVLKTATGAVVPAFLMLAPVAPWFARSWFVTGNPFFPLFARLIPTRDFSPESATAFDEYNRYRTWGSGSLGDWDLERRRLILLAAAALVVLVFAATFTKLRTGFTRSAAILLLGTVLVQLAAAGLYMRYWIPVVAVISVPLLALWGDLFSAARWRWVFLALAGVGALAQSRTILRNMSYDVGGMLATAAGVEERPTFLARHLPLYPLYEYANRELPKNSRIALSYYCGGFYIDATTYCVEFLQDSLRLTTWEAFSSDVQRLGITHFLAPTTLSTGGAPPPMNETSPRFRPREDEFLGRLLKERGRLLLTAADQGLYAIQHSPE